MTGRFHFIFLRSELSVKKKKKKNSLAVTYCALAATPNEKGTKAMRTRKLNKNTRGRSEHSLCRGNIRVNKLLHGGVTSGKGLLKVSPTVWVLERKTQKKVENGMKPGVYQIN